MKLKSSFLSFEGISGSAVLAFAMACVWKILGQANGTDIPVELMLEKAETVDDIIAITQAVREGTDIPWQRIGEVIAVLAPALGIQGYISNLRTNLKKIAVGAGGK